MSLRDIGYQSAIELGEAKTEFVYALEFEREKLLEEKRRIPRRPRTVGQRQRVTAINQRLRRIKELLSK